jgi:hypothetical protein
MSRSRSRLHLIPPPTILSALIFAPEIASRPCRPRAEHHEAGAPASAPAPCAGAGRHATGEPVEPNPRHHRVGLAREVAGRDQAGGSSRPPQLGFDDLGDKRFKTLTLANRPCRQPFRHVTQERDGERVGDPPGWRRRPFGGRLARDLLGRAASPLRRERQFRLVGGSSGLPPGHRGQVPSVRISASTAAYWTARHGVASWPWPSQ